MSAGVYNFILNQGTDHKFTLNYVDGQGTAIDITGKSFRGEIRLNMSDSEPLAEMEINVINAVQGEIEVTIPAAETENKRLPSTNYDDYVNAVYDIEMTDDSTGDVTRLVHGNIEISPEVTR